MYFEVVPIEWKGKKVLVSSKTQEGPPCMQSRTALTHFILHNEWDVTPVCATAKTFPDTKDSDACPGPWKRGRPHWDLALNPKP
jgi:hypothetical protein